MESEKWGEGMPENYQFKLMNYGKLFRAARALVFAALALAFIIHNSEFLHATTVTGTVRDSAGKAVSGASISFRLINIGRGNVARDSGTSIVAPAVVTVSSGSDGTFSLTLVGNDSITPAGTLYEVVIRGQGFTYGPFDYSITGASADLNSLTPEATYPNTPSQVSSSQLVPPSGCTVGQDLEWTGMAWICGASGSGATIETNGVENAVQGALDFQTSEDNGVGLTLTPIYQTGGGEKFEITGSNYSGNSATATALASVPTQCTAGQFATGIAANGNANCGTPAGGGGTPGGTSGQVQVNTSGAFGGATNLTYDSTSGATTEILRDKGGQVFNVKAYGAKGNGKSYFDGVTSSGGASGNAINTGNSTTPSVAAVTTSVDNAIAIGVFQADTDWSVAPSVGTNRVTLPSAISYSLTVNDQIKATGG
ncbi:MAG TPA: carboxypeptidase-like regulatory domain-containing protein, partial [Terriglobia bacterium]|nr:carboxypeptidase-like regulatory domain-containing protein [Terriglobia bacterium]